ncbi:DNA (cytosine-5)-methyltransferase 1 [Pseudocercospora fuligena]|uniref:DNA (cytosine-5-)-methyltransferase n=1 Tax=Pseudocercospora fuligena TaxID=685502 RepID=A0A8H6VHF0_9PEZI|nr:DNA (cytosine-5)-methyltransferase 1 [Pseudocercospora fuligena]
MPKRRRGSPETEPFKKRRWSEPGDDEEDELAAQTPLELVQRPKSIGYEDMVKSPNSSSDISEEAQESIAVVNGIITPRSEPSASIKDSLRARKGISVTEEFQSTPIPDSDSGSSFDENVVTPPRTVQRLLSHVELPGWTAGPSVPRALFGWSPSSIESLPEHQALPKLVAAHDAANADFLEKPEYTYFTLDQFSIYKSTSNHKHAQTLVALHELSRDRHQEFCFDGVLSVGQERYFVEQVPFRVLTVDGYDDFETTDIESQLCVQSARAAYHNVWYKLGAPGKEYERFYKPFLWVARFTKHAIQYMLATERITLHHFRASFYDWLQRTYSEDASLRGWLGQSKTRDFAIHFVAYADFLWKECHGVQQPSDDIKICKHPIWREALPYSDLLKAIPRQLPKQRGDAKTIVTPFAYENFSHMYFADQILETPVTEPGLLLRIQELKARRGLTPWFSRSPSSLTPISAAPDLDTKARGRVVVGDIVAVPPEDDGRWKSNAETWYAYVQRVWKQKNGQTRLDVIWLYHPQDTTIGKAQYVFSNELFFSDNCGCGVKEALHLEEVTHKVDVVWNPPDPSSQQGLFVRQKFRTVAEMDHYDFRKIQDSDFCCCHQAEYTPEAVPQYRVGDTVLVEKKKDALGRNCELAQILSFESAGIVQLRRFLFKKDTFPAARPNELLLSSELFSRHCEKLVRECHVRIFSEAQIEDNNVPTPYDRDGAGDYYFVADTEVAAESTFRGMPFRQGWNPQEASPHRKLKGLGIFCGGGTFDRGLQEGGAVQFTHAVDYAEHALHSYRANSSEPVKFFLGSVDDYLSNAMSGQSVHNTATTGEIEVISAGSPCQGFSKLQLDRASARSRKNASMVASVVSFVDFYVPEYLILENVVSMTDSIKDNSGRKQNVFSQVISALVGLGYQVQQFLMDSWSCGSPQQRSRVFIIATAPSAVPLSQPEITHAHPMKNLRTRNLGRSSNGLPFGTRRTNPFVALPFVTAEQSVADLPKVYDSVPQLCIRYPDHRLAVLEAPDVRARIAMVPTQPRGWGLIQAHNAGRLRGEPLEYFIRTKRNLVRSGINSKSYSRVSPDHLFPTIVTKLSVGDGMNGRVLHWDQHRPLTVMEARRALGYLDHEVLIGTPDKQLHIVGNSVDRKVALVLGLALRESWLQSNSTSIQDPVSSAGISAAVKRDASHSSALPESVAGDAHDSHSSDIPSSPPHEHNGTGDDFPDDIDNRTVKMSLNLSQEEIQSIRNAEEGGKFKEIFKINGWQT